MKPTIFISYSRQDETWMKRVANQLGVAEKQGQLTLWYDQIIGAGEQWEPKIEAAMNAACVAVLLVSANYLNSEYVLTREIPRLLERERTGELRLVPILLSPCHWDTVSWLRQMNLRPDPKRTLSAGTEHQIDEDLAAIAKEIQAICQSREGVAASKNPVSLDPEKINIWRLPPTATGSKFFGRELELKQLNDAWADPKTKIFTLVAMGGMGKSALVNHWLRRMSEDNYLGAERIYAWSFYEHGISDEAASADLFIDKALHWFGDPAPAHGDQTDKGERLAKLINKERVLLVLDGLEPLQSAGGQEGRLKDHALRTMLRVLAVENSGLCVISTRVPVRDLSDFEEHGSILKRLGPLSDQAGAGLLYALGVIKGTDAERELASKEFGGHSLALTLLGTYLRDVCGGNVSRRGEVDGTLHRVEQGEEAQRVMKSYEKWYGEGPELAILRMLSLFKRPADSKALKALRKPPVIPGLTDALQGLDDVDWSLKLTKLQKAGLMAEKESHGVLILDSHALVREYFKAQLKKNEPAWREGNHRLYGYLKNTTKEFPETIEEMAPLYAAVAHACEAGKRQEAFDEIYWPRILRKTDYFSTSKLSAFGAELVTLPNFFDHPWSQPACGLTDFAKATVLHEAGFSLRARGQMVEAAQPLQASLELYKIQAREEPKRWKDATIIAGQLGHLYLVIGNLNEALRYTEYCVEYADKYADITDENDWPVRQRAALARTLHYKGDFAQAEKLFIQAEEMQKTEQPHLHYLYWLWGFFYCELLLDKGRYQEALDRAKFSLDRISPVNSDLMRSLDYLILGRAHFQKAQREKSEEFEIASRHLKKAVDGLRQAGRLDQLPRGLLARSELRTAIEDERAKGDLKEAISIAESGQMELHQADCHLVYARSYLLQGKGDMARASFLKAKSMINRLGYHRRDGEVVELEKQF